ncbi:hypothetical protein JM93_01584 [Roseibium hamelinense]|uniref:Lambda family phage tail tape measure protein n=1 Tax=Roseibium hamelinense TaxID=150831 RepID=A0A562T754_9HYPH|nr:phage tail tape measure protein [Roseibium hamelinense]MTI43700.1 phage tail tape measure protein [Roseibium hamelinense]TWI89381.1 hypothetical protein JM93_01584 [Roseibium hamelinense]
MNERDGVDLPLADMDRFARQMDDIRQSAEGVSRSLASGLKAALVDGKSLDAVFRQMALSVSNRLVASALKPLDGLASSLAGNLVSGIGTTAGKSLSGLLSGATPFAKGGVVAAPTYFGMGQDGLGLMGEAGAEAVLPLQRGSDGRLGVKMGSGAGTAPVQINVTTQDAESFRRSEAQVSAMVARAVGRGRRGL